MFPAKLELRHDAPSLYAGPKGPAWAQGPMGPLGCMRAIPPEGYPPFSNAWGFTKGGIAPGGVASQGLRSSKWGGTCLQNPGPISENGFPRQGSYDTTHPACLQGPEGPAWAHVTMGPMGPMGSWGLSPLRATPP